MTHLFLQMQIISTLNELANIPLALAKYLVRYGLFSLTIGSSLSSTKTIDTITARSLPFLNDKTYLLIIERSPTL